MDMADDNILFALAGSGACVTLFVVFTGAIIRHFIGN